jgi:hypothetical protein
MTEETWVRHLKEEDILELQSLMLLLAGRNIEERESAFKGILEILNPVVVGVRIMEAVKPAYVISEALEARDWDITQFVDHLFFRTSWGGSSRARAITLLRDLLAGVERIDDHAASMLSFGFECPSKYWLDIQVAYDNAKGTKQ